MNLNLSATDSETRELVTDYPRPPALHWGYVLLFHMLTFGIFGSVWMFRQAMWVRQIDPMSNAVFKMSVAWILVVVVMWTGDSPRVGNASLTGEPGQLLAFVWAYLSIVLLLHLHRQQSCHLPVEGQFTIPGTGTGPGHANPSPSTINVSGLTGTITDVNVTLTNFVHTCQGDIEVLLVAPTGQKVLLIDGTTNCNQYTGTITIDDEAATTINYGANIPHQVRIGLQAEILVS